MPPKRMNFRKSSEGGGAYNLKAKKFKSLRNRFFSQKKLRKKCVNPGVIFGPFGVIVGHFGSFLGHFGSFWVILGPFWTIWGHIWATLGHIGSFSVATVT